MRGAAGTGAQRRAGSRVASGEQSPTLAADQVRSVAGSQVPLVLLRLSELREETLMHEVHHGFCWRAKSFDDST